MANQLFHETIKGGDAIPALIKHPTTKQLVKWGCLMQRYYEIHYDKDFAVSLGLPGVVVWGEMVVSFLNQMLTDWIGDQGTVRKLSCSFRGAVFPGEDIICKGTVSEKYTQDNEHYIKCEVWAENPRGEKPVTGEAVISV